MRKATGGGRGAGTPGPTPAGSSRSTGGFGSITGRCSSLPAAPGQSPPGPAAGAGGSQHCPSPEGGGVGGEWGGQGQA